MSDAEHAGVLRRKLDDPAYYMKADEQAALERAIELLEPPFPKMRSTARAEREARYRTGTDVLSEPVSPASSDTPITAPQAFIPGAQP